MLIVLKHINTLLGIHSDLLSKIPQVPLLLDVTVLSELLYRLIIIIIVHVFLVSNLLNV